MNRRKRKLVGLTLALAMTGLPFCDRRPGSKATADASSRSSSAKASTSPTPRASASASPSSSELPIDPKARDTVIYPHEDTHDFEVFRLPPNERQGLLDRVFGRGQYLNSPYECDPKVGGSCETSEALRVKRSFHQFWPVVVDKAHGSFTAAKRQQMLFVIGDRECGCLPPWSDSAMLAVFEKGAVVRAELLDVRSRLVNVVDIDGDGQSDIVIGHNTAWQGVMSESIEIVRFAAGKLQTVRAFADVYHDTCDAVTADAGVGSLQQSTVHLFNNPDGSYAFRVDQTSKPCAPASGAGLASASAPH